MWRGHSRERRGRSCRGMVFNVNYSLNRDRHKHNRNLKNDSVIESVASAFQRICRRLGGKATRSVAHNAHVVCGKPWILDTDSTVKPLHVTKKRQSWDTTRETGERRRFSFIQYPVFSN